MSDERWCPHVTVAAIAERDGGFLLVEETIEGRKVINQPAGHLEPGESLIAAVRREALEETAWHFEPEGIVGVYRWEAPAGETFLRVAFRGRLVGHEASRSLDPAIDAVRWLTRSELELAHTEARLRSPLVWQSIQDYCAGRHYPLDLLRDLSA